MEHSWIIVCMFVQWTFKVYYAGQSMVCLAINLVPPNNNAANWAHTRYSTLRTLFPYSNRFRRRGRFFQILTSFFIYNSTPLIESLHFCVRLQRICSTMTTSCLHYPPATKSLCSDCSQKVGSLTSQQLNFFGENFPRFNSNNYDIFFLVF